MTNMRITLDELRDEMQQLRFALNKFKQRNDSTYYEDLQTTKRHHVMTNLDFRQHPHAFDLEAWQMAADRCRDLRQLLNMQVKEKFYEGYVNETFNSLKFWIELKEFMEDRKDDGKGQSD